MSKQVSGRRIGLIIIVKEWSVVALGATISFSNIVISERETIINVSFMTLNCKSYLKTCTTIKTICQRTD